MSERDEMFSITNRSGQLFDPLISGPTPWERLVGLGAELYGQASGEEAPVPDDAELDEAGLPKYDDENDD